MRLKSSVRRRLLELLTTAGTMEVACALPWVIAWRKQDRRALDYLLSTSATSVVSALNAAEATAQRTTEGFADCRHAYLLEQLLAATATDRRQRGIYFTPVEIVRFIVRAADEMLRSGFAWPSGLASETARILDPSTGSGVFLAEVLRIVKDRQSGIDLTTMLPRLVGWEIMPAGVVAAHCVVAAALREVGCDFSRAPPLRIELRDALASPNDDERFNVILGNPPYASLSTARHGWVEALIQSPNDGYLTVDGRPLGEKKHWLHDDYVKFLRLAQWHVQQSGCGVVGVVTNHGYLANASFRGMRASLLKTFPRIQILDLHGNAKMHERSPDGSRDENVFNIASGAAIGIFARPATSPSPPEVCHSELWGSRASKLDTLASLPNAASFAPVEPHYRFTPNDERPCAAYQSAWRLCDAMPFYTSAPVTARDHFVTAFTLAELVTRVEEFCDLAIPDEVIRQRYFGRTRSTKYPSGDSRGWKLSAARRALAADDKWRQKVTICQYRPYDYRPILWHEALIDWPRRDVMRHLLEHENIAIIARRQSPAGLPTNFFWATRMLTLDGILRSDNRGSESLFSIWRYDESGQPQPNFAPEFVASFERIVGKTMKFTGPGSVQQGNFTALTLAGYVYGLFWSSDYRQRYQPELSADFPRILLPNDAREFFAHSHAGLKLLRLHTHMPEVDLNAPKLLDQSIAAGFPRWREGQVWINATASIAELSEQAWQFKIGMHQVAQKWLKDRRGRTLTGFEIATYRGIAQTLAACAEMECSA